MTGTATDGDVISFKIDDTNFATITLTGTNLTNFNAGGTAAITLGGTATTGAAATITAAMKSAGVITLTDNNTSAATFALTDVTVSRGHHAPTAATDITSSTLANSALGVLDAAITNVNSTRAGLGASMSRLEYASDNLQNVAQNTASARSRVMDADYAAETTELARTQIIQQASTAMLAQANQSQQAVLALLR